MHGLFLSPFVPCVRLLNLLQKGDLLTTETTEISETKDNFIFH